MDMKLPFSTTGMMLHIDDSMDYEVLSSSIESMPKSDMTVDEIVLEARAHPIGSPKLSELAKGKENVVIICSDHTRPVPSKHIIPFMLKEIREGNHQNTERIYVIRDELKEDELNELNNIIRKNCKGTE